MNLIEEVVTGNRLAFEQLFNRYKERVFNVAFSMSRDPVEAEDIVQEVFIKVYKSIGKYRGGERELDSWLRRITLNECVSRFRKNGVDKTSFEKMSEAGYSFPQNESFTSPETHLMMREKQRETRELLNALDQKHYMVMVLRFYHELSYGEIAEMLRIPVGTVRSRLSIAIKTLRTMRARIDEDEGRDLNEGVAS